MKIIFTEHAKNRMKRRNINKEEIINTINNSAKTLKIGGKYYAQKNIGRSTIEVVYEKDKYINVITIYYI